jgi:hypothetical protein
MHDAVRAGAGAGAAWCCSRGIPLLALLVTLGSIPAEAATQQYLDSRSLDLWKNQDACISASIKQFPDHDLASLQQRDRSVDACLAAADLPPRAHLVPDP